MALISNKTSKKTEAKWKNVSYLKRIKQVEKIDTKDSTAETWCIDKRNNSPQNEKDNNAANI